MKQTPGSSLNFLSCEVTAEGQVSRKQALTRHPICCHLGRELPSLQNYEEEMRVVYKLPSV